MSSCRHALVWAAAMALGCANPYAVPSCADGVDNDGDGVTDLADADCDSASSDAEAQGAAPGTDAGTMDAGPDGVDAGSPNDAGLIDGGAPIDAGQPIRESEILGTWDGAPGSPDFGNLYLRRVGPDIRGVFEVSQRRLVGDYDESTGMLDCWWSQNPNRRARNAGPCSFQVTRIAGGLHAEGEWERSTGPGVVNRDWDIDYEGPSIPASIDPIFGNDAEFVDGR